MTTTRSTPLLRWALIADGIASGATGLLMLLMAGPLGELLQVPSAVLAWAGFALVPYAAFVAWLGTRDSLSRLAVIVVIAGNVLWAIDSVIFAFSGWVDPSALGYAFILFQAVVVAGFAELQWMGLRQSTAVRLSPAA